jgi:hypothetical protein
MLPASFWTSVASVFCVTACRNVAVLILRYCIYLFLSYLNCSRNILMFYVVSLVCHAHKLVYAAYLARLWCFVSRRCPIFILLYFVRS